ncbi:MAG TPA: MopE-related protein, partial [Myxococcales bacterium]
SSSEDVVGQAPWRVQGSDTVIPFDVSITDAGRAGTLFHHLRLGQVTIRYWDGAQWRAIYDRSFGGVDLADSPATDHLWVLHVTRGAGGALDGLPLTARNIVGAAAEGQTLTFQVVVQASGGKAASYSTTLKTHVGEAPLPHGHGRFALWYAGDTHLHTMYTTNIAEFGLPHRSTLDAAVAIGLDFALTTDHSCDLDPTCMGAYGLADDIGTRIEQWTFCENAEAMPCLQRSNAGLPDGWAMADGDAHEAMTWAASRTGFQFHTGEEVNAINADGKTVHSLAYRSGYVVSKSSGNPLDCDALTLKITAMLGQLPAGGLLFAAHPTQPLPAAISGGGWTGADFASAVASPAFAGLELWNMRATRGLSSPTQPHEPGGLNPFTSGNLIGSPCDPASAECHPAYLDAQALPVWDELLSKGCAASRVGPFAIAGSDAHGDFNYMTLTSSTLKIDTVTDNALGRARTAVLAPTGGIDDVLDAVARGRAVLTDGPMVTFGVDLTGDGTIDQIEQDAQLGSQVFLLPGAPLRLRFKWQSTAEFGDLTSLRLLRGDGATVRAPAAYGLFADPEGLGDCELAGRSEGTCAIDVSASATMGLPPVGATAYFRVEAKSGEYRALTNPIWVTVHDCRDQDGDGFYAGADCTKWPDLAAPGLDCDDTKPGVHPGVAETCDGVDQDCNGQTDEGLGTTTCGIGACRVTVNDCEGGQPKACVPAGTCPAPDACHLPSACAVSTGACGAFQEAPKGTACEDGDPCTTGDACEAGACLPGAPKQCPAPNDCHEAPTCDPATGQCGAAAAKQDGAACEDGNPCSLGDQCASGQCVGGAAKVCAAPADPCLLPVACDSATGECPSDYPSRPNGETCDDLDPCTVDDVCQSGKCGGAAKLCPAVDPCNAGACDPTTGACIGVPQPDGTLCGDGDACTNGDSCVGGACLGGPVTECAPAGDCKQAGQCDPASGTCTYADQPDGTACDDANPCTTGDACRSGTCSASSPVACPAAEACHAAGQCNPSTGQCEAATLPDGTACDDGDAKTLQDACAAGKCAGKPAPGGECDGKADGTACSSDGTCQGGACKPGTAPASPGCGCGGTGPSAEWFALAAVALAMPRRSRRRGGGR